MKGINQLGAHPGAGKHNIADGLVSLCVFALNQHLDRAVASYLSTLKQLMGRSVALCAPQNLLIWQSHTWTMCAHERTPQEDMCVYKLLYM